MRVAALLLFVLTLLAAGFPCGGNTSPDPEALDAQARDWYAEERYLEAAEIFREALAADPARADSWLGLGLCLLRLGEFTQAEDSFQQALLLEPDDDNARVHIALACLFQGKNEEAHRQYLILRSLESDLAEQIEPFFEPDPPNTPQFRIETGMHTAPINRLSIHPDGTILATASADKTVRVWDAHSGELLRVLRPPSGVGPEGTMFAVAFSPDGETLACSGWTGSWDNSEVVTLFQWREGQLLGTLSGSPSSISHLCYTREGDYLAAALGGTGGVMVFSLPGGAITARDLDYGGTSEWVDISRDGTVVTTSHDGYLRLYRILADGVLPLLAKKMAPGGLLPVSAVFSPDGSTIAVGFQDSSEVNLLSGTDLSYLHSPDPGTIERGNLRITACSPDGEILYAGGNARSGDQVLLVRWSAQGMGPSRVESLFRDTIMDIRVLPNRAVGVAGFEPALGMYEPVGGARFVHVTRLADWRAAVEKNQLYFSRMVSSLAKSMQSLYSLGQ